MAEGYTSCKLKGVSNNSVLARGFAICGVGLEHKDKIYKAVG